MMSVPHNTVVDLNNVMMIGENRQLVTKEPVEVQDFRQITDRFGGIYRIYPNIIKENRRMSTCDRLDLQTLGSRLIMPEHLSRSLGEILPHPQ